MSKEKQYENWFMIHSGLKKPSITKGGFLSVVGSELNKVKSEVTKAQKPEEKPKEEKKVEKGTTAYEKWFYRNCDNNNEPDLAEIKSHDYEAWFERHSTKRIPDPQYASAYEAWFFRNCDNRNIPDVSKVDLHDYDTWFKRHCVKREPEPKYASAYEAWFFRNCDNRNIPDVSKVDLGLKEIVIQEILGLCLLLF